MQEMKNNFIIKKDTSQLQLLSAKVKQNASNMEKWHPMQARATTIPKRTTQGPSLSS